MHTATPYDINVVVFANRALSARTTDRREAMTDEHRIYLEARLKEAQERLLSLPRGTVAWRDALAAVHQLERVIYTSDELPPTPITHGSQRHRPKGGR